MESKDALITVRLLRKLSFNLKFLNERKIFNDSNVLSQIV